MSDESRGETGGGRGFRVVDRRRFDADGSERAAETGAGPRSGESAPDGPQAPAAGVAGADFVLSEDSPSPGQPAEGVPPPEASLSALFLSLSTTALVHLGEISDVATGRTGKDLAAARGMIDLLAVLQTKTRGNLDPEEAQLLDGILYDLRMRFVDVARA